MIVLNNISKKYGQNGNGILAVDNISLQIDKGDFVSIVGKSGCGKSTLLNIIGSLTRPTQGEYLFCGENVVGWSTNKLAAFRGKNIGFVLQSSALIPEITVMKNIELSLMFSSLSQKEKNEAIKATMDRLEILHNANKYPNQLSGGEQQRVAIARAIIKKPSVVLADEPTGALDENTGAEVFKLLCELNREGISLVLVTHDMQMAEQAQKRYTMKDGKIFSCT